MVIFFGNSLGVCVFFIFGVFLELLLNCGLF